MNSNFINTKRYKIYFGDFENEMIELVSGGGYDHVTILVDENTRLHCLPLINEFNQLFTPTIIEIYSGEIHKNIKTCQIIWGEMMQAGMGRRSLMINLGGGVIGDMGGFCASTFKRGIDFIQIPTTLLSQVDASVGGKTGIDFGGIKNSIGVFSDPIAVFIHPEFLKTLPEREIRSGHAEIIKHALIRDGEQWIELSSYHDLNNSNWNETIRQSVKIKHGIVEMDPFEKGIRKALNFGHTIGHAIESVHLGTVNHLLHGEAIAIGMVCESYLSHIFAGLDKKSLDGITAYILGVFGHQKLDPKTYDDMLEIMKQDKKNKGKEINFSFIPKIGAVNIDQTTSEEKIKDSLEFYNCLPPL